MSLAAPLFLLAVVAAAIPVLLHMIHYQQAVEAPFSTLRFLRVSVERTRRRKYVDDALLLLLRCGALVLIAVGLAKPTVTTLRLFRGGGSQVAVVLILDNSASMGTMDAGQPRFETARHAAEQVLDGLREGDQAALLLTGGPASPELGRLHHAHDLVRQAVSNAKVSYERGDLASRLAQARALLAEADATRKEVYVLTDNQALSWQGVKPEIIDTLTPGANAPLVLVPVNRDPGPNVALRSVRVEGPALTTGVPLQALVEVVNTSSVPQQKHLELYVDGIKEATSPTLHLPPGAALRQALTFTLGRGGVHRGEVKLGGDDALPQDNQLSFVLSVDRQVRVAIVKPSAGEIAQLEDSFYLEKALAPGVGDGWAIEVNTLTVERLAAEPLAGYSVIYCVNLPALPATAADRLRDYVGAGGRLVWLLGPNVVPAAYNDMNTRVHDGLLPGRLGELREVDGKGGKGWSVGYLDGDHPALTGLTDPPSLYQSVLVHKLFPLPPEVGTTGKVLARLADGQPLLVERPTGSGSVVVWCSGATPEWTNLPLKPLFLPLVARLTFYLAGAEADRSQVVAGAPLLVPLGALKDTAEVEVSRPNGETVRVKAEPGKGDTFRYADAHDAGIYVVRIGDGPQRRQMAYAVNPDPDEADTTTVTVEELRSRFGRHPLVVCDNPDDVGSTVQRLREGRSLWEVFLGAVLLGLVLEVLVANRKRGDVGTPLPRGQTPTRGAA